MAVARPDMVGDRALDFDLRIVDVIAYDTLTIVIFACQCRWVVIRDREPITVACPEHGGPPLE